jgi:diguanylate cyclase (GGDEF)-like protein
VPTLDLYTLIAVSAVNLTLAGAAMLLVAALNTGSQGILRCAVACGLFVSAFAFLPLRLATPGSLGILLTNIPLFAGGLFLVDGITAFRERKRPVWLYLTLAAIYLPAFNWFLFVVDDYTARVVVHSVFLGAVALLAAWAMGSEVPEQDRAVYWSTAAGFALYGLVTLARGYAAVVHPVAFMQLSPVDMAGFVSLNLATLGCAFGLSMATSLKLQRRTERLALYDPLTNLPNRRFFEEKLEQAARSSRTTGRAIGLIYCDLDNFKSINDTFGHEAGDRALRIVARRLREMVREDICLARIGGDEFVLLIENMLSREVVHAIIRRLRRGVAGEIELAGKLIRLDISCGMAVYPEDVGNVSDLLRLADAGMYMMKQHGREIPAAS